MALNTVFRGTLRLFPIKAGKFVLEGTSKIVVRQFLRNSCGGRILASAVMIMRSICTVNEITLIESRGLQVSTMKTTIMQAQGSCQQIVNKHLTRVDTNLRISETF